MEGPGLGQVLQKAPKVLIFIHIDMCLCVWVDPRSRFKRIRDLKTINHDRLNQWIIQTYPTFTHPYMNTHLGAWRQAGGQRRDGKHQGHRGGRKVHPADAADRACQQAGEVGEGCWWVCWGVGVLV